MSDIAVVTGASSGIGAATAVALAAAGREVVLAARRVERCEAVVDAIEQDGGTATALFLDLDDEASVASLVGQLDELGPVTALVSNAGEVLPYSAVNTAPDEFARQVGVNLNGAQRLVHALAPGMVERRRGDLVFVTSDVVRSPRPSMASYVASKWGLEGLARALQMELEGTGVRSSIVRPGPTLTGMADEWDPGHVEGLMKLWTDWGFMRHHGYLTPEAVANAVVAVLSVPQGTNLTLVEVEPEAPPNDL